MFAALGSSGPPAIDVARTIEGVALVAIDGQRDPTFTSLVIGDDRDALASVADLGLYRVEVRRMRHQRRSWPAGAATPGVTAAYPVLHHPAMTHEQTDAHWRDVHAPLALRHHPGMWHYHQISIDEVLAGAPYDGIALCAFPSDQDLRERFFGGFEDQAVISTDVARFADVAATPGRVRMTEWRFGAD